MKRTNKIIAGVFSMLLCAISAQNSFAAQTHVPSEVKSEEAVTGLPLVCGTAGHNKDDPNRAPGSGWCIFGERDS